MLTILWNRDTVGKAVASCSAARGEILFGRPKNGTLRVPELYDFKNEKIGIKDFIAGSC